MPYITIVAITFHILSAILSPFLFLGLDRRYRPAG